MFSFRLIVLVCFTVIATCAFAQRQPIAPQQLREANVANNKRVWRVVELNEKQNQVAKWPKNPLINILYESAANGQLKPYINDSLTSYYNVEQFVKLGCDTHLVKKLLNPEIADDESFYIDTVVSFFIPTERIHQFIIMEEIYFDTKQGQQRTQIIAIAPLFQKSIAGIDLGNNTLCWFKYFDRQNTETDCRDVLVNKIMYNAGNPYQKFSYDDWFEQRHFSSFMIKESNSYDQFLEDDPEIRKNQLNKLINAAWLKHQQSEQENDYYEH